MNSLRSLEEIAGIDILTPLAKQHKRVIEHAKVSINEKKLGKLASNIERLEYIIDRWKSSKSIPHTWAALQYVLCEMDLNNLSQHISDYIGEYCTGNKF